GGIERLTEILAREWAAMGHDVVVATVTPGVADGFPFRVVRAGDYATFRKWGGWCDVHLQMNVSLKYTPLALIGGGTIIVSHQTGYWEHVGNNTLPARAKRSFAHRLAGIACSDHIRVQIPRAITIRNPYDHMAFQNKSVWGTRLGDLAFLGRLVSDKG